MTSKFDTMMNKKREEFKLPEMHNKKSKINAINNSKKWTKCIVLNEDKTTYVDNIYIFDYPYLDYYTSHEDFKKLIEKETGKKIIKIEPEDKYTNYFCCITVQRGKSCKITFE